MKVRDEHDRAYQKFCEQYREFILTDERNKHMVELSASLAAARGALEHYQSAHYCSICGCACAGDRTATDALTRLDAQAVLASETASSKPGAQGAVEPQRGET